ncbi:MAG: DUF1501 domain-containing protein [Gemmatimonadetes bacterium]|nr:DUF1501 domain-containing protein [Gemmatimonadota bacterium]
MRRREFILGMCAGGLATYAAPMVSFARVPGRGRLVFVLLRGGFDGLAAIVPYGDPGYQALRGAMAYGASDLAVLEDGFGLSPGLSRLSGLWDAGELAVVHAMAIPYRTRSHFDGQAILETGLERPDGASDGWLNRLLQVMDGERAGLAVAAGLPRSLSGEYPVATWSPVELGALDDGYLERLHVLYRADRALYDRFEAGLQMREVAADDGLASEMRGRGRQGRIAPVMRATARFVGQADGPNVAAVEFGGWDTHANQGMAGGSLDRLLGQLAEGILAFREEVGTTWAHTTMVVMTEFGRTARPNGTGGTDHGTAGAGLVIGPGVSRGRVVTDWPGLADRSLYEGRDLKPTLDTRAILKGVIAGVFDLTAAQTGRVFPGSDGVRPVYDLIV